MEKESNPLQDCQQENEHTPSDIGRSQAGAHEQGSEKPSEAPKELTIEPILDENEEDAVFFGGIFRMEDSPIFKMFEELKGRKLLSQSVQDALYPKLQSLFRELTQAYALKKQLQVKNNSLAATIQQQWLELERSGMKKYADNSEISELKRDLLRLQNETQIALEEEQRSQQSISAAAKAKQDLVDDIEEMRRSRASMLEPQLISATKELKLEAIQKSHQIENLSKDLEEKENMLEMSRQERSRLELETEKQVAALSKAAEMPSKIARQTEAIRDGIQALEIENEKQNSLCLSNEKDLQGVLNRKKQLEDMQQIQNNELELCRKKTQEVERQCDEIFREHEWKNEQYLCYQQEAKRLEASIKNAVTELQVDHDKLLKSLRDKDAAVKNFRRLTNTVNNLKMAIPSLRLQQEHLKNELESAVRDAHFFKEKAEETKKDIDLRLFEYLENENYHQKHKELLQTMKSEFSKLEAEWQQSIARCKHLNKESEQLELEKDVKARDLVKIQSKVKALKEDLLFKDVAIGDANKRLGEANFRLKEFMALYDSVKAERNKFVDMIQATHQKSAEMRDKLRILSSQVEILRHEILIKDRELSKQNQDKSTKFAMRDLVKSEANKSMANYKERRDQIDRHLARIESLNTTIAAAAEEMSALQKKYENFVVARNSLTKVLIEQNDELCVLYEKLNLHEHQAQAGEASIAERGEELKMLQMSLNESQRQIENYKKQQPSISSCKESIATLQTQLSELRDAEAKIEEKLEDVKNSTRIRDLGGEELAQKSLLAKVESLERMLATKEEKLLEMDLVLNEVSTLTDRLREKGVSSRDENAATTEKLSALSKRIDSITKSMMARISELSLNQAMAMTLHQEKTAKEVLVKDSLQKLEQDEAPSDAVAAEVAKEESRRYAEVIRAKKKLAKRLAVERGTGPPVELDEDNFYCYSNIRTKAEPRPSAYIPSKIGNGALAPGSQMAELPLPKPYGALSPFKPQQPSSHLIGYKRPTIKPVEF